MCASRGAASGSQIQQHPNKQQAERASHTKTSASQNAHAPSIFFGLKALDRNKCTKHNEKTPPKISGTIAWNIRAEHVFGGPFFRVLRAGGADFGGISPPCNTPSRLGVLALSRFFGEIRIHNEASMESMIMHITFPYHLNWGYEYHMGYMFG